jgi:hypothetical protein
MSTAYRRLIFFPAVCLFAAALSVKLSAADAGTASESAAPPVELTFQNSREQGIRLAIPREYLKDDKDWDTTFAVLTDIRFPDMQPPPPRRTFRQVAKALADKGQPATMDNVLREWELDKPKYDARVPLQYSVGVWIQSGIPQGTEGMIDGIVVDSAEYDDPLEPMFRHYRDAYKDGTAFREYLIPRDEFAARSVWIDCLPRNIERPDYGCLVNTTLGDRLGLKYNIPRKDVALWREVDTKVKDFVRQHVVDCFDGIRLKPSRQPLPTYACQFPAGGSLPKGKSPEAVKKIRVIDVGKKPGYFDDAWPELEPAILKFIEEAGAGQQDARAHVNARKIKGNRFVAYARMTIDPEPGASSAMAMVTTSCAPVVRMSRNPTSGKDGVHIVCQSSVTVKSASGVINELPDGPRLEYDPDEAVDQSQAIREWSKQSAAFIHEKTGAIIEALRDK